MTPKERIKLAIHKYVEKNDPTRPTRKNKRPEKDLEREILAWLKLHKFDCTVVESKSTYSKARGRYIGQSAAPGTCDIIGNDPQGRAVFIELKAPGRRNTLREKQREFLNRKINSGCFAVVVDSVEMMSKQYAEWLGHDPSLRSHYLESLLPEEKGPASDSTDWP